MSKLRIFIEGKELDSLESVTVPITKQFEELSNPTVICNDYSKTVTVPLSKNNNEIFGHCYNPDRLIAAGDDNTPLVGIYFDPYKKLDCRLQWGDDVFFTGYAKMLKVTNKGYEVTINGELGKIFQELQKITFDKSKYEKQEDIDKYWIDGSKYVNTQINKELVYKCWNSEQDDYTLRETTDANYDITDIIGFIPNNSFSEDFEYDSYEYYDSDNNDYKSRTFQEYLEQSIFGYNKDETFQEYTTYSPDTVIGDGLYPEQMREYRSYNQIPFIYWNKFWQIFQKKSEDLTGYKWDLDKNWFESGNDDFIKLGVTLLNRSSILTKEEDTHPTSVTLSSIANNEFYLSRNIYNHFGVNVTDSEISKNNKFLTEDGEIIAQLNFNFSLHILNDSGYKGTSFGFALPAFVDYGAFHVRFQYNGVYLDSDFYICDASDSAYKALRSAYGANISIVGFPQQIVSVDNGQKLNFNFNISEPIKIKLPKGTSNTLYCWIEPVWHLKDAVDTAVPVLMFGTSEGYKGVNRIATLDSTVQATTNDIVKRRTFFRSNDGFTLNDICNFDFSNILDYCKRYRIYIYVDEASKKLKFTRSYFNDYTIIDKSDKIDKSSTFEVVPVTFDKKNILFSYAETKSLLGETYKNIYSYPYGAKNMKTSYNFSNESEILFEKSKESIIYTPSFLYWDYLKQSLSNVIYWQANNIFLETRDSDGKTIESDFIYFYPVKKQINTKMSSTKSIGVYISDDTTQMARINKYYYIDHYDGAPLTQTSYWTEPNLVLYPHTTDSTTCLFNVPNKSFIYDNYYFDNVEINGFFYWEKYLDERYNVQNKKVTTYIRLTPQDFINFKFNQFWKIGNQIYIVNKIYDYDITSDKPTKVDLITVQNIEAYKN